MVFTVNGILYFFICKLYAVIFVGVKFKISLCLRYICIAFLPGGFNKCQTFASTPPLIYGTYLKKTS